MRIKLPLFILVFLLGAVPSAVAATFFVATTGNDSNPGTEAQPWRTIGKCAATMVAGDTCIVKAGTYNETVTPLNSGTAGNLITYKANPGDRVVIDGQNTRARGFDAGFKNYIRIEGFEIINHTGPGGNPIEASSCTETCGIGWEIVNNHVHNNARNTDGGAIFFRWINDSLIEGNESHNNQSDGITILQGGTGRTIIRNNHIHHNDVDGIKGCPQGGTLIIEGNYIHNQSSTVNHGDGFQLLGCTGLVIVRNNVMHSNTQNFYFDTFSPTPGGLRWGDIVMYNNLAYNPTYNGGTQADPDCTNPGPNGGGCFNHLAIDNRFNDINSFRVYENTFAYGVTGSGCAGMTATTFKVQNFFMRNNVFYNCTAPIDRNAFVNGDIDFNVYWASWSTDVFFGFRNFAEWKTYIGQDANSLFADPLLVDATYPFRGFFDHHLTSLSPAKDFAAALTSVFGLDFAIDKDGVTRPQGLAWDSGAFEFSLSQVRPLPPTNLRVVTVR